MTQFTIRALKANDLEAAWPVVRSSNSYANVDWWLSEAADLLAGGGGVLVAFAPDSTIHGVATFKRPVDPAGDKVVLAISMMITFELSSSGAVRNALVKSLERIATKLECTHLMLPLAGNFGAPQPGGLFASAR